MLNELTFEEEGHIYSLNGRRLVSVTQALSLVDDRYKTDPYFLERGRFLHRACELWSRNELDEDTVDPVIQGRFMAYMTFVSDTGFIPSTMEQVYYHPVYLYGFKPDITGTLNSRNVLIDLKSSKARVDKLQGAAYCEGLKVQNPPIDCKAVFDLYLNENGTYKLEPVNYVRQEFLTFLAALTAYRWKEKIE